MAFKCAIKICSMSPKEHSVLAKQDYKDFSVNYEWEAQSVWWSWLQIGKNLIELIHSTSPESGSKLSFLDQWLQWSHD